MPLTNAEIEALRHHLGYGNVGIGGYTYTGDGFYELFYDVVAPNLSEGNSTTAPTVIAANSTTTVTPVSMTGIVVNESLVIDVGDDAEIVIVKSVTGTQFTAAFKKAHAASGYPVAVLSGIQRCRWFIWQANAAFLQLTGQDVGATAGLKKIDEIEFFSAARGGAGGNVVLEQRWSHYMAVVNQLSHLCRIDSAWGQGAGSNLEPY